ncbi:4'-phosphopantetheinyl transferase [Peniophora sp. CONT]|nr:4'-phosphopantetheinyl transferase [Peniophora sp. CONT]
MSSNVKVLLVSEPTAISEDTYKQALELVDVVSRERCGRFYHRADSYRCLIGRLLPRVLLARDGVSPESISFAETPSRKPYIATPKLSPPLAFNVSHDNELVGIAYARGERENIGLDLMRVSRPRGTSYGSFVESVGEALTAKELKTLLSTTTPLSESWRRFYRIWTTKEAYTKALGLGLGFDFARIDCSFASAISGTPPASPQSAGSGKTPLAENATLPINALEDEDSVRIDGVPPHGWEFRTLATTVAGESYEIVAARRGGNRPFTMHPIDPQDVEEVRAQVFLEEALRLLS